MASREKVIAEVRAPNGVHLKYMVAREDSTKVPVSFLRTAATAFTGFFLADAAKAAAATDQLVNSNATKAAIAADANATAVKQAEIAAGVETAKIEAIVP